MSLLIYRCPECGKQLHHQSARPGPGWSPDWGHYHGDDEEAENWVEAIKIPVVPADLARELYEAAQEQWLDSHAEHCTNMTDDCGNHSGECHWPRPGVLARYEREVASE